MPSAAPDTDAAAGVDGTAQPIGGCPHHLGRDKDREAVRRSQWDPGSLGLGVSQTSFRMGAFSEVYLLKVRGLEAYCTIVFLKLCFLLQPTVRKIFHNVTLCTDTHVHEIGTKIL